MSYIRKLLSVISFFSPKKESAPVQTPSVTVPSAPPVLVPSTSGIQAALSWELPCHDEQVSQGARPDRQGWSEFMYHEVEKRFDILMSAKDIRTLIPKMDQLSRSQIITAFCELLSTVAKYECSWNPGLAVADVNARKGKEYLATGLFQMNAADDQRNYRTGTSYSAEQLKNPYINIEVALNIIVTLIKLRGKITYASNEKSPVLRYFFATLVTDGKVGKVVLSEAKGRIDAMVGVWLGTTPTNEVAVPAKSAAPWYTFSLKYDGKKETDPEFNREMTKKWSLFGLNLGTIAKSWAAWCGLAIAVSLAGVGLDYQNDGQLARNWGKFGVEIAWQTDGIPQGAIVWVNHDSNCKSESDNHVTMANGFCAPSDLVEMAKGADGVWRSTGKIKKGATFSGRGGNQANTWKVSSYPVEDICAVRWPKDYEKPGPVLKSLNCSNGKSSDESTR